MKIHISKYKYGHRFFKQFCCSNSFKYFIQSKSGNIPENNRLGRYLSRTIPIVSYIVITFIKYVNRID